MRLIIVHDFFLSRFGYSHNGASSYGSSRGNSRRHYRSPWRNAH